MQLEARDASGSTIRQQFGVMAVPQCMVGGIGLLGALALVGAVFAIRGGGWGGWTLGIIAALVAIAGLGFVGFALWGRYAGMPWTFGLPAVQ